MSIVKHWGLKEMAIISLMTFSNAFYLIKMSLKFFLNGPITIPGSPVVENGNTYDHHEWYKNWLQPRHYPALGPELLTLKGF